MTFDFFTHTDKAHAKPFPFERGAEEHSFMGEIEAQR